MDQSIQNTPVGNVFVEPTAAIISKVRVGRRASDNKETKIELVKNGTTIEAIHITCACGEKIVIDCIYPDDTK